jgi:hypothetical protein
MTQKDKPISRSLADLPDDELIDYGQKLGLHLTDGTPRGEALRRVRRQQDLLLDLDHDALLDIVVWMRRPVRKSASKEALAKEIATGDQGDLNGLSQRGLEALARLRGLDLKPGEPRTELERRVTRTQTLWVRLRRARRRVVGRAITRMVMENPDAQGDEYRFLPENGATSLRQDIEDQGVVGGIARKLRGVADDYVREKLDEIEARIDGKLDEIDQRLAEWRDREIANRLRILKFTLIFSILVALVSLLYDFLRPQ